MESGYKPKCTQKERSISELSAIQGLGDDLSGTFSILSAAALFVLKDKQRASLGAMKFT